MPNVLVFVESNTSGTGRLFIEAANKLGFSPILLAKNSQRYDFVAETAVQVIACDTSNSNSLHDVCRALNEQGTIAGITTSSEYYVEMVAQLTQDLHLSGPALDAVKTCRNKAKLRERLRRANLESLRFAEVKSVDEVLGAVSHIGLPLVVKPASGSGSVGVRLCTTETEAVAQAALNLQNNASASVLLEEYVEGYEYSVEVFNGEPLGITRKFLGEKPFFVETGHDFPASLNTEDEGAILDHVRKVCREIGLTWGPAHVEIKLDITAHPQIIEINPRLAGGFIPELVRLSTGINLIEETILLATRQGRQLCMTQTDHAAIRFIVPHRNGKLEALHGLEQTRSLPLVSDIRLYKTLPQDVTLQGDFRDRIGHVITQSKSPNTAGKAAQIYLAAIHQSYLRPEQEGLHHECP